MRGFTGDPNYGSDFLVNGFSSSRGYNGLRDSANIGSIEILKGPAAARRHMASPSVIWRLSEQTTLSYELEAFEQRADFDRGVVAVNGVLGLIPNSRFLGEAADGPMTVRSTGHQLFVQHDFSEGWSLQGGLSYRSSAMKGYSTEASSLQADGRTLWRQRRYRDFAAQDLSGRVELLGKLGAHHVLAGVDGYRFIDDRLQLRKSPTAAAPYSIDIYQPVYGGVQPTVLGPSIDTREEQWQTAVYAQDQIDIGAQWKALIGVRRDAYRQTITNYNRSGLQNHQTLDTTSPRAGIVYQPDRQISLYASAGKSFRPNSGIGINNESFPAESSRAYEAGVKYDGRISSTLALYSIRKKNVLTLNPVDTNYSLAAGEVGSKGVELDVAGEIARKLQLSFSYAYTDAKVLQDNVLTIGSALANVPKQSANLMLVQEFGLGGARASFGGGFNYVGERNGDVAISSKFKLPAYTTAKLVSSYSPTKQLRLSLDVDNLFNKVYYPSSYQQTWVAPGEDRRVTLKLQYKL